jgi:acetyl esterase/lipase
MHGGGFVVGSARDSIPSLQDLARTLDCVIVTVEYRLAPETRFPGALEDNYAALKWLYAHAEELGADRARIAVMGGSAGGGHAAMLAIAARDRGEVPIVFQALTYPMLDDRTGSTVHKPPQQGAVLWTPESNRFGWSSLLGVPAGSASVPAGSVPARETNLKGLPPTFIGVGSIDLFVDEDLDYAQRLLNSGVFVELVVVPGGFHGFDLFKQTRVVQRYEDHYVGVLRQALGA